MSRRCLFRKSNARLSIPRPWLRSDVLVGSMVINLTGLALPVVILQAYDRVVPQGAVETFSLLLLIVVGAVVLEGLLRVLRSVVMSWEGARFDHLQGIKAMSHLLDVDTTAFRSKSRAYYLDKMHALDQIQEFFSGQALLLMVDFPFVILFLLLVALIAGPLVWVPVALLGIFVVASLLTGRWLEQALKVRSDVEDRRQNFIMEALDGIHTLKSMAMEPFMVRRFERLQEQSAGSVSELSRVNSIVQGIGATFSQLASVAFVSVGSLYVVRGELTIGALAAGAMLSGRVLQPGLRAMGLWTQFQSARLAREKVEDLFVIPREQTGSWRPRLGVQGRMQLSGVTYQHAGHMAPILSELDLVVESGEMVAITGKNGVGKSTLIGLLAGFIAPQKGHILLDGKEYAEFDAEYMRSQIGIVPQTGTLFHGTILENMTLYREGEAVHQAVELSRWLGLEEYVAKLPDGLDTRIGGGSVQTLPEGVRQKIVMVRSLIGNPPVILFDDANANLDIKNDRRLMDLIMRYKGERTMVVVSHRPSFLRLADRQLRLSRGKLLPVAEFEATLQQPAGATVAEIRGAAG